MLGRANSWSKDPDGGGPGVFEEEQMSEGRRYNTDGGGVGSTWSKMGETLQDLEQRVL